MDLAVVILISFVGGIVLGYLLCAHHASSVASAVTRATTLPSGDVAALNAKIAGLGDQVQSLLNKLAAPTIAGVTKSATPPAT